jgi:hypothetical protein
MKKKYDIKWFLESFIFAAVILVIVQTIVQEFSRYDHWSVRSRNILLAAGFCFDLLFFIEFIIRSFFSGKRGEFFPYIKSEGGWADFLSSLPLLIFDSGPQLLFLMTADTYYGAGAMGLMSLLKAVKLPGIIRFFRFGRVIKTSGKFHNSQSKMARQHVSAVLAFALLTVITAHLLFMYLFVTSADRSVMERFDYYVNSADSLKGSADMNGIGFREFSEALFMSDKNILKVIYSDGSEIVKMTDEKFRKYFNKGAYIFVTCKGCTLIVSAADINSSIAMRNLQSLIIMFFVICTFLIFYAGYFVRNISDVIHVMNLGFRKKDFNLMVKIPEGKTDHEIFKLAEFYNEAYLPSKMKRMAGSDLKSSKSLSMKDFTDLTISSGPR